MHLLAELLDELWHRPWRSSLVWPIIIINLAGSLYGYYWYRAQLAETPLALWPVVPDSPLSTTLFTLALIAVLSGRRPGLLAAVACATCIKYGLWAAGINIHFWWAGGDFTWINAMLLLSHLGMAVEGFIFLRVLPLSGRVVLGTTLWMVFNDYMDYLRGCHPHLFMPGQEIFAMILAAVLTAFAFVLLVRSCISNHKPVN